MRRRNHPVTIRLSEEEYEILLKKIKNSKQTQQQILIDGILQTAILPQEYVQELSQLNKSFGERNRQLRGLATNVNQMAKVANREGYIPSEDILLDMQEAIKNQQKECDQLWQSIR